MNALDKLTTIEDTLFIPVMGRIYASEQFPNILKDEKALELKSKIPDHLRGKKIQNQYAALAGAVRSANMDRYIQDFLKRNPSGAVVQLSCGLETTFYRCDNGKAVWYEVDVPDIIDYRKSLLRESERDRCFAGNAFACQWLEEIRLQNPMVPVLVLAGGLLHYFPKNKIIALMHRFQSYGNVELVFDALNDQGMKRMSGYMKQIGHEDNSGYFYVNSGQELCREIGGGAELMLDEKFFSHVDLSNLGFLARYSMRKADRHGMMKMVALKL